MKKFLLVSLVTMFANQAYASSNHDSTTSTSALHPKQMKWEFDGFFGRFDRASAQRGFQVYKEVCATCHSLKLVSYRSLTDLGFSEDEVKHIASEALVNDGPNDDGEMFDRAGLPSDRFVSPYANDNAARSANGGALPPDLSLMVKARHDGANYIYSILTGFSDAPDEFKMADGKSYNPYFEGRQISMPAPITDDSQVDYRDGTFASKEQMAIDVVNFLQWAAEPETEARKKMGIRSMIFLAILLVILIAAKRAVWHRVK